MSEKTKNLGLFKYIPETDGKQVFSIVEALNNNWDILDEKGAGSGFNLFDTKLVDHVLEGKEAEGWALQGTYVYKEAVAGSRYGYPDFYEKCLEEYQNPAQTITFGFEPWTQPIATGETTAVDGGNMVITASNQYSTYNAYKAMDGIKSGTTATTGWGTNNTSAVQWWQVKFPYKIKITGLTGYQRYDTTVANANTVGRFYTSSSKTTPIGNTYNNAVSTNWNAVSVTGIPTEGIITDTIYFEKTGGGNYGGLGELVIEAEKVVMENPFTVYKNSNGHMFYNISQKANVDDFFNKYGSAWFYGIDTANERILLPRNNYFEQASADVSEVAQSVEAGLPNITGSIKSNFAWSWAQGTTITKTGALSTSGSAKVSNAGTNGTSANQINIDASLSNEVYGNSDTVQPNAVKKLLYICVGNIISDTSWVDVVTQVQGGVKDLEDKTNEGLNRLSNASNALRTTQITNCITEIPQRIKLELNAEKSLVLKAGSEYIMPNGFEEDGVTPKFDYITADIDIQQGNGHAVQDLYFVRNYSSPKYLIGFHATKCFSGNTAPTGFGIYAFWYDTGNNLVKWTDDSGATWTSGYSLPICLATGTETGNVNMASIDQVFNGIGYIGSTVFALPNIKGLIPNGRNADGMLNNIEFTTDRVVTYTVDAGDGVTFVSIKKTGITYSRNYVRQSNAPIQNNTLWYDTANNKMKRITLSGTLYELDEVYIGTINYLSGNITSFNPKLPFRAVDYNDFASTPHITQTYVNGTSWYRVWSDGWCEQGGVATAGGSNAGSQVLLLKPYRDVNYCLFASGMSRQPDNFSNQAAYSVKIRALSTTSFYASSSWVSNTSWGYASYSFSWWACGYIR